LLTAAASARQWPGKSGTTLHVRRGRCRANDRSFPAPVRIEDTPLWPRGHVEPGGRRSSAVSGRQAIGRSLPSSVPKLSRLRSVLETW
jgi:hypothetical protein